MLNRVFHSFIVGLLFLVVANKALAELPLSFTQASTVTNMALGQVQKLSYVIRNNLNNAPLPLNNIQIINDGDTQSSNVTSLLSNCGSSLAAGASCNISVTLSNLAPGQLKRHLEINYNGRVPLRSALDISSAKAKYTVLIYIVGANLESEDDAATDNIEQMAKVGSTQNLNVVLETGGANKPGWITVKRQLVLPGNAITLTDLGVLNMGLTSTIEDFIQWGINNYPAEKYILVFWDHGGGPNGGYGGDEIFNNAGTSISQLKDAVQQAVAATGKQFELIGFDTCLLGNSETVAALYPYTHYFVGSEDSEPSGGWQYNSFLNLINTQPASTGLEIGTEIVNGYTEQNEGDDTTLSLIDATQMPSLLTAISNFSNALTPHTANLNDWKMIARARLASPDFDTSIWSKYVYDLVDLTQFVNHIQAAFITDATVQQTSTALLTATQNAIKYFKNSATREDALGLTLYNPAILLKYNINYPNNVALNGTIFFSQDYLNFLNNYVNFYLANTVNLQALPNTLAFDGANYTAQISNDYDSLFAAVGNDTCTNVYDGNNNPLNVPCYTAMQFTNIQSTHQAGHLVSNISFNKNQTATSWPLINGQPMLLIPEDFALIEKDDSTYIIPVMQVGGGIGYLDVVFSEGVYTVVGFQRSTGSSNSQTKVVPVTPGSSFYLRTYALNTSWNLYRTSIVITAPFTISTGALPGNYNAFRFLVGDLTGALNVTSSSVPY